MNPILIVGAGIGGLCTALALQRGGIEVRVFEAACEVRAAGAGIIIAPNGFRVLAALGLSAQLQTIGVELERLTLTDAAGRFLMRVPDQQAFVREFGHGLIGVLRPALYDLLLRQLEPDTVQTAKLVSAFAV